ncbi:MAG TPA: helix-turn-helix transcriptional regulator [Firmicutes bacterium]|nr:helix-turn-helix transcriptional regulator [Bacillota bacterium]
MRQVCYWPLLLDELLLSSSGRVTLPLRNTWLHGNLGIVIDEGACGLELDFEAQAAVFKALGHETRLRIIDILAREGGKCVCELVERLGFDQSTISKHLKVLRWAGILRCSKHGLNVTYELNMPCVYEFMRCVQRIGRDNV